MDLVKLRQKIKSDCAVECFYYLTTRVNFEAHMENSLPIDKVRKELSRLLLNNNRCILRAPTGSGKSTMVPQFILDDVLKPHQTIIVLQPRRIAARMLASYVAKQRGGLLGEEIGYQVRLEGASSSETRILFVTEGILLSRILNGDLLKDVGVLIFDEFHERHLETDLGLALAMQLQSQKRPDLKVIVMSATIDIDAVKTDHRIDGKKKGMNKCRLGMHHPCIVDGRGPVNGKRLLLLDGRGDKITH